MLSDRDIMWHRINSWLKIIPFEEANLQPASVDLRLGSQIIIPDGGRIIGAEVKDFDRNVKVVRALVYIVACGGLESPRLLLLSRTPEFQNGIGNNHDLVGRCFMVHSGHQVFANGSRNFQDAARRIGIVLK